MGREIRMVPKDWKHPKREDGSLIALFDSNFAERLADWEAECAKWDAGDYPDYASEENKLMSYSEWAGERPDADEYMPEFKDATHLMMYENTSEGTPISPAFKTPEELASWLYNTKASAFGGQTASASSWLRVCKGGYAPSAVLSNGIIESGVEAMSKTLHTNNGEG